jgi:hypothetical protein
MRQPAKTLGLYHDSAPFYPAFYPAYRLTLASSIWFHRAQKIEHRKERETMKSQNTFVMVLLARTLSLNLGRRPAQAGGKAGGGMDGSIGSHPQNFMASGRLVRWSGLAAMLGSILFIAVLVARSFLPEGCIGAECDLPGRSMRVGGGEAAPFLIAGLLLIGVGLAGVIVRVWAARRWDRLGKFGLGVTLAGVAALATGVVTANLSSELPPLFVIPGLLLCVCGLLLLALTVLRAQVLPSWTVALLLMGALALLGFNEQNRQVLMAVPFGLAWFAVGFVSWSGLTNAGASQNPALVYYLKKLGVGLLSGLVAGLILGIGARLAMRIIALVAHQSVAFSMEGTLGILLVSVIVGLVAGPIFVMVQAYIPGAQWRGSIFGLIILGLFSTVIPPPIQEEIANAGDHLPLILVLFVVVFIVFGMTLQRVPKRLTR